MGKSILRTVVDLLTEGGLPAAPAQPEEKMAIIHTPVAAVSIEKVDTAEGSVTVLVEVVAPIKNGGERCQEGALTACSILQAAGAECVQGGCTFHSRPALFRVPVTARFYGTALARDWIPRPTCSVTIGDTALEHVQRFSAQQVLEGEGDVLELERWSFTLEEFFPNGAQEPADTQEPFTLQYNGQVFDECTLTERQRIYTANGIAQIRKGYAASRTIE